MTERQLEAAIVKLATLMGWMVYTVADSRSQRSHHPGYPDLTMVRGDRLVVAELKSEKGRLRPGQQEWLDAFCAAGAEAYLWKPADWRSGRVECVLR